MTTPVKVEIGAWLGVGWKMFTAHWSTWAKMAALAVAPMILPMIGLMTSYFAFIFTTIARLPKHPGRSPGPPPVPPVWMIGLFGASMLAMFFAGLVSVYVGVGMWKAALKQARGGVPSMSDLRGNGALFVRVLGATFVIGLLTFVGLLFCYIPGLVVMGWYAFVIPLMIDKDLSLGDAMERSKAATSPQLVMFILWTFLVSILAQLGSYVFWVGMVFSLPFHFILPVVAYRACFEGVKYGPEAPAGLGAAAPPPA